MVNALAFLFRFLGASAMAIALSNFAFGIASTVAVLDVALQTIGLAPTPSQPFAPASVDSEFRFYSVFWFAYGLLLWRTAASIVHQYRLAGVLILLFAMGGVGRILSVAASGVPTPLFLILTIIELGLTLIMGALWLGLTGRQPNA